MSDRKNGLYYESMDIRNHVLSRNIGKYWGYKKSMLSNGGLAIGMPYAVETEYVPYTLSERASEGVHLNLAFTKAPNPKINVFYRQGGLFGYTHEVINSELDWLYRNQNILESYYDYDSTVDVQERLDLFPSSLPWGQSGVVGSVESGGLRAYSSNNDPQNSEYFFDYTNFANSIFTEGLSFQKSLGDHYLTNLLYDGFDKDDVDKGVPGFIDERSGYLTDDIDMQLKPIEDTKLAYIGRIIAGEEKNRQINGINGRFTYEHQPITNDEDLILGLGTGNEDDYFPGISAYNDVKVAYKKFIQDASDVLNNDLDYKKISFQDDLLRKHVRRNKYSNFTNGGDGGDRNSYADYYNILDYSIHLDFNEDGSIDSDEEGYSTDMSVQTENMLGYSVEGFFNGVGVYDGTVSYDEHYDERDKQDEGERAGMISEKISYGGPDYIGVIAGNGFSEGKNSLLSKTKALFDAHRIKTLVGRFHTSGDDKGATDTSLTQTATNPTYGISHGRNLLKLKPTRENGYDNPYCRVWTYHHQYSKMTDLIRPFTDGENFMSLDGMQAAYPGRPILRNGGRQSWAEKTVLNKNGMVNIVPTRKIGKSEKDVVRAKQCMFSIENLAWKGVNKNLSNIDSGEIGPLGGRIMWFPPYNLTFNESVNVSWGANDFIGRGEKVYSYSNTDRTGTLSFTILADHPSILDYWMNSDNRRNKPGTEEDQDTVLRFFAGCENLEAEEQVAAQIDGIRTDYYAKAEDQKNNPKEETDNTSETPDDNVNEDIVPGPPTEFTKDNSIGFYLFYPNNLTCKDFMNNPKVGVNYIVNGKNGFEFDPVMDYNNTITFDNEGNGSALLDATTTVVGNWAKDIYMNTGGPGYEMGRAPEGSGLTDSVAFDAVMSHNKNGSPADKGLDYVWGYGIDRAYVKDRLCGPHGKLGDKSYVLFPENYVDSTDFALNNKVNTYDPACDFSFMDVAEAITPSPAAGGYNYSGKSKAPGKVDRVKKILGLDGSNGEVENNKRRKYFFATEGGASVHGPQTRNYILAKDRADFLKSWLNYCFKAQNLEVLEDTGSTIPVNIGVQGGEEELKINTMSAKMGRYAKAVIYWYDEEVKDAPNADTEYNEENEGEKEEIIIKENTELSKNNEEGDKAAESTTYLSAVALHDFSSTRYRDEEEFFDLLKENDPVLYKNIVDKVKYFDPVYHSITPEGFNARLSFLHQCTRQGPTMSSSDLSQNNGFNGAGYAGNLSFGRAPVCVLRLGDFFNTRIIINSVQINYETSQWDLNPEGIGVQPMLANVTLGFVFQGGSSLGGPIQRLQNAVSFNYYANQEVYDDRADVAVYNPADMGEDGKFNEEASLVWLPGYGSLNVGDISKAVDIMASPTKVTKEQFKEIKARELQNQQNRNRENAKEYLSGNGGTQTGN